MKTISLTESAYQRLLSWKSSGTFSDVVERMVPCKGTLEAAVEAAQSLPAFSDADFEDLERTIHSTRKRLPVSWS
ncbi:MAG: antitoxin VapB family protein [Terrimicrobiaceae bacterium]